MSRDLDLKKIGAQYERVALQESELPENPIDLLTEWFTKAVDAKIPYANAATLSTIGADGYPASRVILIKEIKNQNIIFFTNYNSKKAKDIEHSSNVSLNIYWKELDRQIRLIGNAKKTSKEESETYFHSRPYESQVSAIISDQSSVVSKEELENLTNTFKAQHPELPLPYPQFWGGYKIGIKDIEFWQGRPNRMHDRFKYYNTGSWEKKRLAP